jgi:hypothetical protein
MEFYMQRTTGHNGGRIRARMPFPRERGPRHHHGIAGANVRARRGGCQITFNSVC